MNMHIRSFHKKIACLLCVMLMVSTLSGCERLVQKLNPKTAVQGTFPVTVNNVEIKSAPQKAVVLSASLADVVLAVHAEAQVGAVSSDSTQPELSVLTKVDSTDAAAINAVQPDIILTGPLDDEERAALSDVTAPVLEIAPATGREDYERLFGEISSVFSGSGEGYDAGVTQAQKIFRMMDSVQRLTNSDIVTTACYLYDLDGRAVTGGDFGTVVMQYAGLTNGFSSLASGESYELQQLKIANPAILFCAPGMAEQIKTNANFSGLEAVKNGKVLEMEPSLLEWQGRSIITAATTMAEFAFPQLAEEQSATVSDPTGKIDEKAEEILSSGGSSDAAAAESYQTLQVGDSGDEVYQLQMRLEELGYLTTQYDGSYGSYTEQAVEDFQQANELEVTGTADEKTQQAMFAETAVAADSGTADTDGE